VRERDERTSFSFFHPLECVGSINYLPAIYQITLARQFVYAQTITSAQMKCAQNFPLRNQFSTVNKICVVFCLSGHHQQYATKKKLFRNQIRRVRGWESFAFQPLRKKKTLNNPNPFNNPEKRRLTE
jgi:hypothetical protein